jgi:hypothetical protein
MKSASEMSLAIRRKKKMASDPMKDDAVDLSGIPDDATDAEIQDQEAYTTKMGMDSNKPKARSDSINHQSLMADSYDRQQAEKEAPGQGDETYSMGGEAEKEADMAYPQGQEGADRDEGNTDVNDDSQLAEAPQSNYTVDDDRSEDANALLRRKARIAKMMGRRSYAEGGAVDPNKMVHTQDPDAPAGQSRMGTANRLSVNSHSRREASIAHEEARANHKAVRLEKRDLDSPSVRPLKGLAEGGCVGPSCTGCSSKSCMSHTRRMR